MIRVVTKGRDLIEENETAAASDANVSTLWSRLGQEDIAENRKSFQFFKIHVTNISRQM